MPVRSSISPLIGAEFGGGFSSGERSGGGFTVSGYGGIRLFRLSDAQLELLGSYTAVLAQNAAGAFGVQLGILF